MAELNRFEWLKAVLQLSEVKESTKNIAAALAIEFANDETGKICPAQTTLAEYLNLSVATIKRGIRELVALGWLDRTEGRGAGRFSRYRLKSPCKIIPFRRRKKGSQPSLQAQEKGSPVTEKGIMAEPSYKEQSFEQKSAGGPDRRDGKPSAPPRGPASPERLVFVPRGICFVREWDHRLETEGVASLERCLPVVRVGAHLGFWLPDRWPAKAGSQAWREQVAMIRRMVARASAETELRHAV